MKEKRRKKGNEMKEREEREIIVCAARDPKWVRAGLATDKYSDGVVHGGMGGKGNVDRSGWAPARTTREQLSSERYQGWYM